MIVKDQIKEHYEKHKTIYHIIGTGLVIFTTVIITQRIVRRNISVCDHLSGQRMDATTLVDNSGINVSSSIFQNSQVAPPEPPTDRKKVSYNNTRIRRCEPHRPSWIQFYAGEVQERDQKPLGESPSRFHEFTYKGDNYRLVWPRPYLEER